ncbi:hypothetical protein EVAR_81012_1 [Eumeta japonica]|uniref:Uncharacterized protein n=1 Tax=Eumeta variegata TaxID=151549 RepID=A0A4C1T5D4_EUMVA|nr:hypothetical protein EVAR_81012_1 [Eumeta japonica]
MREVYSLVALWRHENLGKNTRVNIYYRSEVSNKFLMLSRKRPQIKTVLTFKNNELHCTFVSRGARRAASQGHRYHVGDDDRQHPQAVSV